MSQENVEVVKRAVAAVNARDIESYLACCTADVRMENPVAAIQGAYEGSVESGDSSPMSSIQVRISGSRSKGWNR
jgi:hypothetical protein